ncbi:hypothetical protein OAG82_03170 [Rubripirellula sp.]|nr:hypothetical protein [Rubripirellula sp.]MDB4557978.1 hypothetical protein [bacterium]MDB4621840.1 hypothetical protein [Rubripirellula sp.]MDB4624634.1 hypothetical protein [Rubripirellula sp.]
MKRLAILFACLILATPAMAISEFGKQWKNEFLGGEDVDEDFKRAGRKAGCYVCHVKGEDKKKVRNEYGKAIHKLLKAEDFSKEYVKANPEEAKKKILAGFKKAGETKSKDGKTFAEKLKNNELPATDAGL